MDAIGDEVAYLPIVSGGPSSDPAAAQPDLARYVHSNCMFTCLQCMVEILDRNVHGLILESSTVEFATVCRYRGGCACVVIVAL